MSDLAATQRAMHAALTGVAGAAATLVNGSPALPAERRLELYRRSYDRRLVGCLRETYPALRHALGDELFDDFARDYLTAHPPHGSSLADLGDAFPGHLAATQPDGGHERWPDFLVDLARLERAFCEVYDGPGVEGLVLPRAGDLQRRVDVGLDATVELVPCLRLLRAGHPVDDYLVAVRRRERPPLPAPAERRIALSRRNWVVTLTRLDEAGHALLERLVAGDGLAAATAGAGLDGRAAWRRLGEWADRGLLVAIDSRTTRGTVR